MKWHHQAFFALGLWALISPWLLGFSDVNLAAWNNILIGILIVLFELWDFSSKQ
jgi:hypothetical protein